jgi:hypothetical protein
MLRSTIVARARSLICDTEEVSINQPPPHRHRACPYSINDVARNPLQADYHFNATCSGGSKRDEAPIALISMLIIPFCFT